MGEGKGIAGATKGARKESDMERYGGKYRVYCTAVPVSGFITLRQGSEKVPYLTQGCKYGLKGGEGRVHSFWDPLPENI